MLSDYEVLSVKLLGESIGYGNLMEIASALWRRSAAKEGFPKEGCFVPTCPSFIKKKYQCPKQQELYDNEIKRILGED